MYKNQKRDRLIELLSDASFLRWIAGESRPDEATYWDQWKKDHPDHVDLYVKARRFYSKIKFNTVYEINPGPEWEKLARKIDQLDLQKNFGGIRIINKTYYGIAAAVALMIISALVVWFYVQAASSASTEGGSNLVEIRTPYGKQAHIGLPGGSKILLGAHSKIIHTKDWLKQNVIRIRLTGKAYFNIRETKPQAHPQFIITTPDGTVSDWGTRFMVDTYHHRTRVVLEKGDVRIRAGDSNRDVDLKPGQMAMFGRTSQPVRIRKVNTKVYTSWASDHLVFDHTPLKDAVDYMENTFGVVVKTNQPRLLNEKLTGEMKHSSLNELTTAIARVLAIRINRSGDTLFVQSSKRK